MLELTVQFARDACRLWLASARTRQAKRRSCIPSPRMLVQTPASPSIPTTTSRHKRDSIAISWCWPIASICRSCCTTSPGRTGITMTAQTVARLASHRNIVAIKEATGSLDHASEIMSLCDLTVLSGDDSLTLPLMSIGAGGHQRRIESAPRGDQGVDSRLPQ